MVKFYRLLKVLGQFKEVFINKIPEQSYENFNNKVYEQYTLIKDDVNKFDIDKKYMNFAVSAVTIYKVLHEEYGISTEESIEMIYEITYCSAEKIFIDLSFIQMAYYVMCNQGFLNQLILSSLSEFRPEYMEDSLVELKKDMELNQDIISDKLDEYFEYREVPELKEILTSISRIIERYVATHFTQYQKNLTLEDIL